MPIPGRQERSWLDRVQPAKAPLPDVGWLEGLEASFDAQRADTTGRNYDVRQQHMAQLADTLAELGHDPLDYTLTDVSTMGMGAQPLVFDEAGLWRTVLAEKARGNLAELPDTLDEYLASRTAEYVQQVNSAEDVAARAPITARLLGGMGGAMTDKVNIASLGVGATGGSLVRVALTEGAINAGVEAVLQPIIADQRRQIGRRELTLGEAGENIVFAGLGGAVLGGAFETPGAALRWIDNNLDSLPVRLRDFRTNQLLQREAGSIRSDPALDLAELAEAMTPRDEMSGAQLAAVDVLRRQGEARLANPFEPNGEGVSLHDALLTEALGRALRNNPLPDPAARSIYARDLPMDILPRAAGQAASAEARFMEQVRSVESDGNDSARNPRSSATGRYQFTDETWLAYYRRRFGDGGLTREQILAQRSNGRLQDMLMRDLTAENARLLRNGGFVASEGNLYLAHFAGPAGALRVLRADPQASVASVLGDDVIRANPFLEGKTVSWLQRWAHEKMGAPLPRGGRVSVRYGDGTGLDGALARNEAEAVQIADALEEAQRRADELVASMTPEGAPRVLDDPEAAAWEPVFVDVESRLPQFADAAPLEPLARVEGAAPAQVLSLMPPLRSVVATPGRSLNAVEDLAREVGATPDEIRRALTELAVRGEISLSVPRGERGRVKNAQGRWRDKTNAELVAERGGVWDGNFMRKPPAPVRERSLIEWISDRGGIWDEGGDFRAMGLDRWHRDAPFRKPAIRNPDAGAGVNGADTMLTDAIEAGYFPELEGVARDTYADLLTDQVLKDAIDAELRGQARYPGRAQDIGMDVTADGTASRVMDAEAEAELNQLISDYRAALAREDEALASDPDLDPFIEEAALLWADFGEDAWRAIERVAMSRYADLEARAREELGDGIEGWYDLTDEEINDWFTQVERARQDGDEYGNAGSQVSGPGPARTGGEDGQTGPPDRGQEPNLADIPAAERTAYLDPDGPAAKRQADSLAHDAANRAGRNDEDGFDSWNRAQSALEEAVNIAARKSGKTYEGMEFDDLLLDDLAAIAARGGDVLAKAQEWIKSGRIKLEEGELPPWREPTPFPPSEVVPAPAKTVVLMDRAGPPLEPGVAAAKVQEWKDEAARIGRESPPPEGTIILSLFDESGRFSQPYRDMGYEVYQLDIKNGHDLMRNLGEYIQWIEDARAGGARIAGVLAQPPCTTFAGSGARWWKPRHDREWSEMVAQMWGDDAVRDGFTSPVEYNQWLVQTTQEFIARSDPDFFVIENPVGRIEKLTGLPKPLMAMQPHLFGDPYTKRTHLWGKFNTDLPMANVVPHEGSRMHKLRSNAEKDGGLRSLTPEGFAYAFAMANRPGTGAAPAKPVAAPPARPTGPDPAAFTTRGPQPLRNLGPVMFRETSMERAQYFLPGTGSRDGSPFGDELFFSNTAELALGQGSNKGVMLEFDSSELEGAINFNKPSAEFAATSGQVEVVWRGRKEQLNKHLVAITLRPDAAGSKTNKIVMKRELARLEKAGWNRETLEDGGIRLTRPSSEQASPDPAAPALDRGTATDPAIAARQRQEAQLGAEAPMRATAEQDGTMGTPLFDAADQPQFRLDEEGDPRNLGSLLDEIEAEEAELKNIRDCLK